MRSAVQPLSPGPEIVDEAAEDIGLRCLLIARPVQTPAPQRGGRVDLHHGAGAGTIDGAPRSVEVREQDCASQCDVRDLVSRDAQRRDAQFVVYESVGPAHGQLLPPSSAGLAAGQAGMAGVMGGHEMDERVRLAERAVDPGLAGPVDHAHDGVIVGPAADVPDDCAGAGPLDGGHSRSFRSCDQINPRDYHRHRLASRGYCFDSVTLSDAAGMGERALTRQCGYCGCTEGILLDGGCPVTAAGPGCWVSCGRGGRAMRAGSCYGGAGKRGWLPGSRRRRSSACRRR